MHSGQGMKDCVQRLNMVTRVGLCTKENWSVITSVKFSYAPVPHMISIPYTPLSANSAKGEGTALAIAAPLPHVEQGCRPDRLRPLHHIETAGAAALHSTEFGCHIQGQFTAHESFRERRTSPCGERAVRASAEAWSL